jgi:hypothetical protein
LSPIKRPFFKQTDGESSVATPDGNGRKELDHLDVQIKSMTAANDFTSHPDYRRLIGRIVSVMIHEALEIGASEIRLDRFEDRVNVRYRVNGAWKQRDCPPARLWNSILAQLHDLAAGETSQPMFDYIVIDRIPTEIVGSKSARAKYPATLRLEAEQNVVTLIIQQKQ